MPKAYLLWFNFLWKHDQHCVEGFEDTVQFSLILKGQGHVNVNKPVTVSLESILLPTWGHVLYRFWWMGSVHTKVTSKNPPTSLQSYNI